jgi:hypothetical protein
VASRGGYDVCAALEVSYLPADSVSAMMSFATSSVSVPSTVNMFPRIAAVFASFAEPPLCSRFLESA